MTNIISGSIGALLVLVFLGFYVVGIRSLAFAIIVFGVGAMIVVDFIQSVRKSESRNGP